MSKKDKNKENKKEKKDKKNLLKKDTIVGKLKSKCCEKYKKGEDKRCKNCPNFDLRKKQD